MRSRSGALALLLIAVAASGCGDDGGDPVNPDGMQMPDGSTGGVRYRQVEHLARPGINEALLISEGFLAGYNATAPSFAGVDMPTLTLVINEAKTVLMALYLGGCLLNGALDAGTTLLTPGGETCHANGPAIWAEPDLFTGVTLTAESQAKAKAYADKVFDQFELDVMRIDTDVAVSNYLSLCGDAKSKPLLCGGRFVSDDTIDITYNYLLNGAATGKGAFNQTRALTGDGVNFSDNDAKNSGNVTLPVPNPQQYHPDVSDSFPYSAPPI